MSARIITCANCHKLNRIPSEKNILDGICGSCRAKLNSQHPVILTGANLNNHISKSELPIVVDFWAEWCGPCKMMAPILDEAAKQFQLTTRIGKLNTETEQYLSARFNIRSIPSLLFFYKGKEIDRVAGAMNLEQFTSWVRAAQKKI